MLSLYSSRSSLVAFLVWDCGFSFIFIASDCCLALSEESGVETLLGTDFWNERRCMAFRKTVGGSTTACTCVSHDLYNFTSSQTVRDLLT